MSSSTCSDALNKLRRRPRFCGDDEPFPRPGGSLRARVDLESDCIGGCDGSSPEVAAEATSALVSGRTFTSRLMQDSTGTGKLYRTATAISAVMSFIQVAGYWFRVPVRPCVPCVSRLPPVSFYRFSQVHPLPGYRPSCYRPKLCSWFSWFTSLHATGPGVWRLAVAGAVQPWLLTHDYLNTQELQSKDELRVVCPNVPVSVHDVPVGAFHGVSPRDRWLCVLPRCHA